VYQYTVIQSASQKFLRLGHYKNLLLVSFVFFNVAAWKLMHELGVSSTAGIISETPVDECCPAQSTIQLEYPTCPGIFVPIQKSRADKTLYFGTLSGA
jgi:hypothetical protein